MTLYDLLDAIPRFITRHMHPVYVELPSGTLCEVDKIDFRNGEAGTVLIPHFEENPTWDEDLRALRDKINDESDSAYNKRMSPAAMVFNPTCDVISVETAYRLLEQAQTLLNEMFADE